MIKNAFYFILKAPFVLNIFKFSSLRFGHVEKNSLIRKIRLISKYMTSQPDSQANPIDILPNISQSKGNQAMELGQLVEGNKWNVFLQKLYRK